MYTEEANYTFYEVRIFYARFYEGKDILWNRYKIIKRG